MSRKKKFFFFLSRADIISNRQLYRVKSTPLRRRLSSGILPYSSDHSINIDYCGETQGCLIVPQQCNNNGKCEYTLAWEGIDEDTAKFHLVGRAQGFVGVGFSNDEKRVIKMDKENIFFSYSFRFVNISFFQLI